MILFKFRWEMSKPEEYYWQKENVRTLDQINGRKVKQQLWLCKTTTTKHTIENYSS